MAVSWRRVVCLVFLPLAGCGLFGGGGDAPRRPAAALFGAADTDQAVTLAKGIGLDLPLRVGAFTRESVRVAPDGREAAGVYAAAGATGPVSATVRVRRGDAGGSINPFSGGGADATAARSDASLAAMVAAERPAMTDAAVTGRDDVLLVRFGRLQPGRRATLAGTGELAGEKRPVSVTLEAFCCIAGRWSYEYRFVDAGGTADRALENSFARAIAWSREPDASVEAPE